MEPRTVAVAMAPRQLDSLLIWLTRSLSAENRLRQPRQYGGTYCTVAMAPRQTTS